MKAGEVIDRLKMRFCSPEYAFLEQVADGTGARKYRWADGIAMSLWPSRGYDIHGIEVKVSRYDWLNELKNPEKSAAVQQYCNHWWIATPDETIIQSGELPSTWGWMVTSAKGMKVVKDAPALEAKTVSIEFVASVLRNVQRSDENAIKKSFGDGRREGYDAGGKHYQEQYAKLKTACDEFERASGLSIQYYTDGKELGNAVATLNGLKWKVEQIERAAAACAEIGAMLDQVKALADLKAEVSS